MPLSSVIPTSKLPATGTTIFAVMSQLAQEHGAINLGQGFPGFSMDPVLAELVHKFMNAGFNQYAPMPGVAALREVLSEKLFQSYATRYDANDEITITAGGTQAIYTAISALVQQGDEVILFAPAYDCYAPAVELNGGRVRWIELSYPDYGVDWSLVKSCINEKTRLIVINSPHNPAGTIWTEADMKELQTLTDGTNIMVISDEVYEHIVFDGLKHQSCALFPALAARTLIVFSFGKTLHVTGWKMGYIVGPAALMKEFRKVHQYNVFSCNTPVQYAIAEYMLNDAVYKNLSAFYQAKRDLFLSGLANSVFSWKPSSGSYFQLLQFKSMNGLSDVDLAKKWTSDHRITSIPLSVFYPSGKNEGVFRFCFAKEDETLKEACIMLAQISDQI